jgi:tRNA dimethylallyltransferase
MGKIVAIVGPTATGKSSIAVEIAKRFNGEIISCDSMQIYRGMDIGTAKITAAEMESIPHHMIDIKNAGENYSCADFVADARQCITDITNRAKLPIICGGTGLYIDSLLNINNFSAAGEDSKIREELYKSDKDELYRELQVIDPESAEVINPNNVKRVVRAIEIYRLTGKKKSVWDIESSPQKLYDTIIIGLNYASRDELYKKIDERVDFMLENGLIDEVKSIDYGTSSMQAIGYKEILDFLKGAVTLEEAVANIKRNTRRYAKRQITWFKRNNEIKWYYVDDYTERITLFKEIVNYLTNTLTTT